MKSNEEKAVQSFQSGFNCAQAVLTAYSDKMGFDNKLALSLSCGFGGGMGRLQEKCGAVTGAFMVFGIYNCQKYTDNKERKNETYSMIQRFNNEFIAIHGTSDCKSLLKCDLKTDEGQRFLKENRLSETVCEKCITDAIKIVDKLIAQ